MNSRVLAGSQWKRNHDFGPSGGFRKFKDEQIVMQASGALRFPWRAEARLFWVQ
jgi:hypothetical protein